MASLLAAVELVQLQVRIEDHRNGDRNRTKGDGSSSGTAMKDGQMIGRERRAEDEDNRRRPIRRTSYT